MDVLVQIEFTSDALLLGGIRAAVERFALQSGFDEEQSRQITLAVDEAATNVIRHAYGGQGGQRIEMRLERNDARLEIVLLDEGREADLRRMKIPSPQELRPGGRAIGGLVKNLPVAGEHLIGAEHDPVRVAAAHGKRFFCGKPRREHLAAADAHHLAIQRSQGALELVDGVHGVELGNLLLGEAERAIVVAEIVDESDAHQRVSPFAVRSAPTVPSGSV